MKTRILLSALLSFYFCHLSSQIPQGFNYQAIARDVSGNPIANVIIKVKLSILSDTTGFYLTGGSSESYIWEEEQSDIKTNAFGLFTIIFGNPLATKIQGRAISFSAIDWSSGPLFIGTKIAYPTDYKIMGSSRLWSVPYSMVTDSTKALLKGSKLAVISSDDFSEDPLFEVKRKDGQTVFAVYPDAVSINLPPPTGKGVTKGGFAIGGFGTDKGTQKYMIVRPDSIRLYIDDTGKGVTKGGFAIGGFSTLKARSQNFFTVSDDSTRVLTKDPNAGFAIKDLSGIGTNYLYIKPENMFIGKEAGQKTVGLYNSFFGYQSGLNNNTGAYNVFIGYQSGLSNTLGGSNIFLGPQSGYMNAQGAYNVFIGHNSGYTNETGHDNVFVGQRSGYNNVSGNANLFVGQNSGENNSIGTHNVFLGYEAGKSNTTGTRNVYLGTQAGLNGNAGNNNVFIGNQAGSNETGSDKLYIENSGADKSNTLIYGDFYNNELRLNSKVGINSDNNGYSLNVAGDINLNGQLNQNGVPYNPGLVKVELTDNLSSPLPYTNPFIGLLVYNSGTKQPKGFFYWDGNRWLRLIASAAPVVVFEAVTNILGTSATVNASISDDGGSGVVARGFCWSVTSNPAIDGIHSLNGTGTGSFSNSITGLLNNTDYYVRAYAQNMAGIAYSNEIIFNTGVTVTIPVIYTTGITNVTGTTAISGGTISSDGGAAVTARGVCWSSSGTPTTANNKTTDGSGSGTFISSLTSLTMGVTYYVRAYATNTIGTAYGDQYQFTTPMFPVVSTTAISSITASGASSGGNITSGGGGEILHRGVCWSNTNSTPGLSDSKTDEGTGAGIFSSSISGLAENTLFYVRAYATNGAGTSFGNVLTFTTLTLSVSDYDGNVYNTLAIGTQIWMKENLKTTKLNDGSNIPQVTNSSTWIGLSTLAYCWYNNDEATYKNVYGALYNWYAINTNNICPSGWHVPSDSEWKILESFLGMTSDQLDLSGYRGTNEGDKLKESGISHWLSPNSGTNTSGFSALPGGYRYYTNGSFLSVINNGLWWSKTEQNTSTSWARNLGNNFSTIYRNNYYKISGFSVRCIKN